MKGGRALGPGLRRGLLAGSVATAALALAACGAHPSSATRPTATANPYAGGQFHPQYPSWLPAKTINAPSDRVLTGTAAKPAVTVQGDEVEVQTPSWSVRVDVSGPVVPGEGLPYQTPSTTCTWTVTMSAATAPIAISLADFNTVDHLGNLYHLSAVPGQPAPPSEIRPGQTITFQMRAYEAVGEGLMRWAPDGTHIVAMWDFEVEND